MQVGQYVNNINEFTERSVSKLFLASGLQKQQKVGSE